MNKVNRRQCRALGCRKVPLPLALSPHPTEDTEVWQPSGEAPQFTDFDQCRVSIGHSLCKERRKITRVFLRLGGLRFRRGVCVDRVRRDGQLLQVWHRPESSCHTDDLQDGGRGRNLEAAKARAIGEDSLEVRLGHLPPVDAEVLQQIPLLGDETEERSWNLSKSVSRQRNGLHYVCRRPRKCGNGVEHSSDVEAFQLCHRDGFDGLEVLEDPSAGQLEDSFVCSLRMVRSRFGDVNDQRRQRLRPAVDQVPGVLVQATFNIVQTQAL